MGLEGVIVIEFNLINYNGDYFFKKGISCVLVDIVS